MTSDVRYLFKCCLAFRMSFLEMAIQTLLPACITFEIWWSALTNISRPNSFSASASRTAAVHSPNHRGTRPSFSGLNPCTSLGCRQPEKGSTWLRHFRCCHPTLYGISRPWEHASPNSSSVVYGLLPTAGFTAPPNSPQLPQAPSSTSHTPSWRPPLHS